MHSIDVPQCLSLLFITFILDTAAKLGVYVFALDNLNTRCVCLGGCFLSFFFFFSAFTNLEHNNNKKNQYAIYNVDGADWTFCGRLPQTSSPNIFHNLLERRRGDPLQKWEEVVLTSLLRKPWTRLVLGRERKWKRKNRCGCSHVPAQSADFCWNNLVCAGYIAGALEKCCVISFDCCLWSWRLLPIGSICLPCHAANMSRHFFFSIKGPFFPSKKKNSAYVWMMRVGEEKKTFIISQREKQTFITPQTRSFALNIGWNLNWGNLAWTSFILERRHCCFEFGISQEQHHPSYLGRGRHLHGPHSRPSGKVNGTRWEVQWKDLMRKAVLTSVVKKIAPKHKNDPKKMESLIQWLLNGLICVDFPFCFLKQTIHGGCKAASTNW